MPILEVVASHSNAVIAVVIEGSSVRMLFGDEVTSFERDLKSRGFTARVMANYPGMEVSMDVIEWAPPA